MIYFTQCSTVEEAKALYRQLAKIHHPDRGGSLDFMKDINSEYTDLLKKFDGQETIGTDAKTHVYRYNEAIEAEIMEIIQKLLAFVPDEVEVTLIGRWIWVTGETKPIKDKLKELKCRWHRDRSCWFWRSANDRGYGKGGDLEELASKYGAVNFSEKARSKKKQALAKF
jgi:hypothetical protein